VLDRRVDIARSVATAVGGVAIECDVASSASVDSATEAAAAALEGITDLVNNAGVDMNKPLHRYSDDEWVLVVGLIKTIMQSYSRQ
jgi:NADP-dependent 3-hydroxy acid dehydrogenase YdfG